MMESLAKLSLLEDSRLQVAYDWLIERRRLDGGFWCKNAGKVGGSREKELSCVMATMFVLGALAENPKLRNSEIAKHGVDFLFNCWQNRRKMRYAGHDNQIGTDWDKLKYPFTDYKILKFLDVLPKYEYAKQRLQESEMVRYFFQSKTREEGLHQNQSTKHGPILTSDKKKDPQDGSPFWLGEL